MEKVILVVLATINPLEKEAANHYMTQANEMFKSVGAKPLYKYPLEKQFIGKLNIQMTAAIEFPNQKSFDAVFESEAYQQLIPDREKGFSFLNAYISKPAAK
ncbi:DUF1330 domain-containing protein [Reichenbachiella sp.]|uniref:DUF1330 domain-containing protein n=1 Tax=Reichenbachiella sp. TaxID=2184521 RepID=UPI003B5CA69D